MDVVCFVGYTRRRDDTRLPSSVVAWLREEGWVDTPGQPLAVDVEAVGGSLDHLPVLLEDWSMFEQVFEVRSARLSDTVAEPLPSYLAAAVRSFFLQGGRRCLVVPVTTPEDLYLRSPELQRNLAIRPLVPDTDPAVAGADPLERSGWRGIQVLMGADEVSTVCLPDLPWLVSQVPAWITPIEPEPIPRPEFFECADLVEPELERVRTPPAAIGRCDEDEYRTWAGVVQLATRFLERRREDVQLVAALPLPVASSRASRDPIAALVDWRLLAPPAALGDPDRNLAHRQLQLVYPWIGWDGSRGLPEHLEPPDGAVAGILARGTLLSGAFAGNAGRELYEVDRFTPTLSRTVMEREPVTAVDPADLLPSTTLVRRVSLIGPAPGRFELLSDVTTSAELWWHLANVERLRAVWIRALREAGEALVFEPNHEQTWATVRRVLEDVGLTLFRNGGLRGETPFQAFRVRCDKTTMTQRDIDEGRLIAEIWYRPVAPLEQIRISLALTENRHVSIVAASGGSPA